MSTEILLILILILITIVYIQSRNTQQFYLYQQKMNERAYKEKVVHESEFSLDQPGADRDVYEFDEPPQKEVPEQDCKNFINNITKEEKMVICDCKNIAHALCRDDDKKYVPANDKEKKCVSFFNEFKKSKGDICQCVFNFHDICQDN